MNQDLVCFSKLVGAIPDKDHEDRLIIDLECLARILRQSIFLLNYINESPNSVEELDENYKSQYDLWLDKSYTDSLRQQNQGFAVYLVNDISKFLIKLNNNNQISRPSKIVDLLKSHESLIDSGSLDGRLGNVISSEWFQEFITDNLSKGYQLSRLTILVAIWIIAVDCHHKVLEQLIGGLIDQIYHEEANSNSEEELLQLRQVGSFWVTYYKKHEATIRQMNSSQTYDDNDDGERSSFDDDATSVDSSSNSSVSLFNNSGVIERGINVDNNIINDETMKRDQEDAFSESIVGLRSRLRRLIDDEVLHGVKCIICLYEPTELFEPLNTSFCPKCSNLKPVERCSISYRPLELVCLDSLMSFKPNITKLILVSPNEWARYLIAPKLAALRRISLKSAKSAESAATSANVGDDIQKVGIERQEQQQVGEHVVVTENYERLTVIRGDTNQARQKMMDREDDDEGENDKSSSSSIDSSSSASSSSSRTSSLLLQENDSLTYEDKNKFARRVRRKKKLTGNQRMDGDTYISTLENYMKVRLRKQYPQDKTSRISHTNSSSSSETIEMFKIISTTNNNCNSLLPVCLTDLLIMDTSHDGRMLKIALVTSNNKLLESGSLWSCSNRSPISKLRLGCSSVFTSVELTRLSSQSSSNEFICPHCECQPLIRLRKLDEEL